MNCEREEKRKKNNSSVLVRKWKHSDSQVQIIRLSGNTFYTYYSIFFYFIFAIVFILLKKKKKKRKRFSISYVLTAIALKRRVQRKKNICEKKKSLEITWKFFFIWFHLFCHHFFFFLLSSSKVKYIQFVHMWIVYNMKYFDSQIESLSINPYTFSTTDNLV